MGERGVALVHCKGGLSESVPKALYQGISSCAAVDKIAGGGKACSYGCLGLGTCRDVCPVNAIIIDENHRRWVDRDRCTGCGLCVEVCPRHLIELVPRHQEVLVVCKSGDKGGRAKRICSVACTGCKRCEKVCEADAIHVEDNLAPVSYTHLRAHETRHDLVCRLLLEKKKKTNKKDDECTQHQKQKKKTKR